MTDKHKILHSRHLGLDPGSSQAAKPIETMTKIVTTHCNHSESMIPHCKWKDWIPAYAGKTCVTGIKEY